MRLPLVAIVGRPNVGKSTLVNRIATGQRAIVDERAGITRDRNYIQADWGGRCFTLIDTGGLDFTPTLPISEAVTKQALLAVEEADAIIFVVDGTTGPLPDDEEISKILRVCKKPVFLVVNKIDHPSRELAKYTFYELGLGDPWEVSALHGLGIGDLLDELVKSLPPEVVEAEEEALSVAIVGHPNVGKSSILNRLLGWERVIVSEVPGTTRDAVDTILERDGKKYRFIDTAGLRRRKKLKGVEYYGFVRTLRVLDGTDLALIVLDAVEGATERDQKIAELAEGKGCASIILVNKWDLIEGKRLLREQFKVLIGG
jgi:GTP-binding protein